MIEIAAILITFGAILYNNLSVDIYVISLFSMSIAVFLAIFYKTKQGITFSFLIGLLIFFGAFAVSISESVVSKEIFGDRAFTAKVISVDQRLDLTHMVVREGNNRMQVFSDEKLEVLPGDSVNIRGRVERPESFMTDSGRIFDYPNFLESRGIVAIVRNVEITVEESTKFSLTRFATQIRFFIADIFSKHISFPNDGITSGMLVGYQGGLPKSIQDLFRDTGVLHVLVLSGYNITLLAGFLAILFKTLPFKARTIVTIACVILLVLISGSGIASIRAGIMGSIALFAGLVRRTYSPLRALTLAYLLFFFISPSTIFSDPGFHLSFIATAFMILMLPKIESIFKITPATHGVNTKEILLLSLSIPLFMLPYIMYFSGIFPVSSPMSNIVLSLATPLIMIAGGFVLIFSFIPVLAGLLGALVTTLGDGVIWFLTIMDGLPKWQTPEISWFSVLLFYTVVTFLFFRKEIISYVQQLQNSLQRSSSSSE